MRNVAKRSVNLENFCLKHLQEITQAKICRNERKTFDLFNIPRSCFMEALRQLSVFEDIGRMERSNIQCTTSVEGLVAL